MQPQKKRKRGEEEDENKLVIVTDSKKYKRSNKKGQGSYSIINRGPSIIPSTYSTKLRYVNTTTINSTLGAIGINQYRGNSLFDPDFSGTGNQPMGFDQLSAFYNKYRVLGCLAELQWTSSDTTQMDDMVLLATNESTITGGSDNGQRGEYPYAKRKIGSSLQSGKQSLSMYLSTAQITGASKQKVRTDDAYSATTIANPLNPWFWTVSYQSFNRASSQTIYYTIKLTYYCSFFERGNLVQS